MTGAAEVTFWCAVAIVGVTYVGYPAGIGLCARLAPSRVDPTDPRPESASVLLCVRNERARIAERMRDLAALLEREATLHAGFRGELIVVADGSTDDTATIAQRVVDEFLGRVAVRVLERDENRGKATSLNEGAAAATGEVLVMADVRQRWDTDAITQLLDPFRDPLVGAVSGELVLEDRPGVLAGVGLYWKFEKWLRAQESSVWAQVGVSGAISAVRRALFRPLPDGLILDDVGWPLQVVRQGKRVVFAGSARAFDRLPERASGEFRRKLRTLAGNFQLVARAPWLVAPWANPIWTQFVAHKLLRLLCPWAMLAVVVAGTFAEGGVYKGVVAASVAFLVVGLWGTLGPVALRGRVSSAIGSFLMLNAAAWLAFWFWAFGLSGTVWKPTNYNAAGPGPP
ncbi:MAG: glycosyltransferase family 2 protein [Lacipirellulaceae bacterium]